MAKNSIGPTEPSYASISYSNNCFMGIMQQLNKTNNTEASITIWQYCAKQKKTIKVPRYRWRKDYKHYSTTYYNSKKFYIATSNKTI